MRVMLEPATASQIVGRMKDLRGARMDIKRNRRKASSAGVVHRAHASGREIPRDSAEVEQARMRASTVGACRIRGGLCNVTASTHTCPGYSFAPAAQPHRREQFRSPSEMRLMLLFQPALGQAEQAELGAAEGCRGTAIN